MLSNFGKRLYEPLSDPSFSSKGTRSGRFLPNFDAFALGGRPSGGAALGVGEYVGVKN
jgi:hypothetical protein